MINTAIVDAFSAIAKERNIDRSQLSEIIVSLFDSMIVKKYETSENFDIIVNLEKGEIEIYQTKKIVKKVADPTSEIDLKSAAAIEPDLSIGDDFIEVVDLDAFGRRLVNMAKQNLAQRIRDAEKDVVYERYKNRVGEIVIGEIQQVRRDAVIVNIDKTEVAIPRQEQIYTERYRRGDTIRAVVKKVERSIRGPDIVISRADPQFLIKLFEIEVPEIVDGVIEILKVARAPGDRAKIAVISNDKRIDPVGACVGMKGIRIQSIVRELNNEKVDIINYSENPVTYITRALSPAKPIRVEIDENDHKALAIVEDDDFALAVGRNGHNVRLAAELTGCTIEAMRRSEEELRADLMIADVEGLTPYMLTRLTDAGYEKAEDVLDAGAEKLLDIPGFGPKTVDKVIATLDQYFEVIE